MLVIRDGRSFVKRLLYLATLSLVASMMFAPAALGQSRGPSGADGTFNCPDFDFQEDAQAVYDQDTSDPNGLDGAIGTGFTGQQGVACEELPSRGTATDGGMTQQPTTPNQYTPTTTAPTATTAPTTTAPTTTAPTTAPTITEMPATGGPSLLVPAGLLLASGLIGLGLMRRK